MSPSTQPPGMPGSIEPLLAADEAPAFERLAPAATMPLVLCCDHASKRVPRRLGDLGLEPTLLDTHIARDLGAAALTRLLAQALPASAILNGYSRLVIDCNRDPADPAAFPESSDGIVIPGNVALAAGARAARVAAIYQPYHAAIDAELESGLTAGLLPMLLSVHSFTPQIRGQPRRTLDVGVLWKDDDRVAAPLLHALRAEGGLEVGDNEPYSAHKVGNHTAALHAGQRGLPHVTLEIRQDLLADADGQQAWCRRLTPIFRTIVQSLGQGERTMTPGTS